MNATLLNEAFDKAGEVKVPENFEAISAHNLYLYVKSYQAALRANTTSTKTRSEVSGGGKKPWSQKGRGTARSGSNTSPVWVGGGVAFGPSNNRNYNQKINKKQKKLALNYALNAMAKEGRLFIVDSLEVASGKTKDANGLLAKLNQRDALLVKAVIDEKTYFAFRNLQKAYLVEENELNAFLVSTYYAVVIEKKVWENLTKEG